MQQNRYPNQRPQNYGQAGRKSFALRLLPYALILLAVAGAVLFGVKALRDKQVADEVAPYANVFAGNISVDGLPLGGLTAQQAYDQLFQRHQAQVDSWQLSLDFRGHTYATVNYQTLGISVQSEQLVEKLREAWLLTHTGDNYQIKRSIESLKEHPYAAFTTQSELSDQKLREFLSAIAANISQTNQPRDAELLQFLPNNADPFLIQHEAVGYQLDIEKAREEIMAMASSGTSGSYQLSPETIEPKVTAAQIRRNLRLRSEAQTAISTSSTQNRDNNIRVAMSRINGTVLEPGQTFSYNKVVGKRTHENGFFDADEMVAGDLVTGIGGGVCQPSTTLYQAALLSNLGIVKRTPHGQPVRYTEKGLDATVYYYGGREIDFKFRNTTKNRIYITAHVTGTNKRNLAARIRIYGEPYEEGVRYALSSQVVETLSPPAEIIYRKDTKNQHVLYNDETLLITKASEGYVVESYLDKYVNGQRVESRLITKDTYRPRQQVEWVGVEERPM